MEVQHESGVHRTATAIERRPWLLYLALAALSHPILEMLLFGERALQTAHDVFDDDVPRLFSIAADWRAYGPSLWDPHLTAGNALFAQFALPAIAPDVLLSFVVPPFVAYFLNAALMAFLAGLAMHLFLRDSLGLSALACFAGGIMSSLASWHYILGYAALLLPLSLLWTNRAVAIDRRPRDVVLAALLVAFMAISSLIQIVALAAAATLAWVILTAADPRDAGDRAGRFFVPWVAGALLAAPVVLTQLLAVPDSQRQLWVLPQYASPLGTWFAQLARIPLGIEVRGLGGVDSLYGSWFPGVIGLPLLLASLAIPRPTRQARAALALLVGLLLAGLLALLVTSIQDRFGLLASFQFVRVQHLVPPFVVMNVALAIGWLGRRDPTPIGRTRRWLLLGLAGIAALALMPQALLIGRALLRWGREGAPLAAPAPHLVGWWTAAIAFGAGVIALLAIGWFLWRNRRTPAGRAAGFGAAIGACLLLGLVAERAAFARAGTYLGTGLGTWADTVPPTKAHEFIAAQPGGGRVLSLADHANRALSAGLDTVDGYETIYPLRYHELFAALIAPQRESSPAVAAYFDDWGNRAYAFSTDLSKPIADLLGVRWLYVAPESRVDPALRSLYLPRGPVGPGWVERLRGDDGLVYENLDVFPRAFIVHASTTAPDLGAVQTAMLGASSSNLRSTAFLEAGRGPEVALGQPVDSAADAADLALDTPDRVEIRARTAAAGLLVLADTFARGWTARVDGRDAEIIPVDLALRGVALPAGDHTVTFVYRPIETIAGFGLSLATVLALGAWVLLARRRPPRESP